MLESRKQVFSTMLIEIISSNLRIFHEFALMLFMLAFRWINGTVMVRDKFSNHAPYIHVF